MLPAHLQVRSRPSEDDEDDDRMSSPPRRPLESPHSSPPPLGLTGVVCDSKFLKLDRGYLHYTVFRPRYLPTATNDMPPPLLCVAGGPLLSCTYLTNLVHWITDRALVFYNPLGVGQSKVTRPNQADMLTNLVNELQALIDLLGEVHLLGHSFGGIVAYEILQRHCKVRSLIVSNTPVSVAAAVQASHAQLAAIAQSEHLLPDDPAIPRLFLQRHECRIQPLPLVLQQTLESAGMWSSTAQGWKQVQDYVAQECGGELPPALLLQGGFDYVDTLAWKTLLPNAQTKTLPCAHYGMLEVEELYGKTVLDFLRQHDPKQGNDIVLPNGVHVRRRL